MVTFSPSRKNILLTISYCCSQLLIDIVQAASITPNYKSCGYAALGDVVVKRTLDEHHYLDLTQNLILDETSAKWVKLPNDPNYINEPALAGTATAISDNAFIMDGGYSGTPFVRNITRIYNSNTNTWTTISNENRNLSYNAIYMGTAVFVPDKGKVYYWGGLSGQYPGYAVNTTTVLSLRSSTYTFSICPGVLPPGSYTRFGHTATLDNDGVNIFYIGGRIRTIVSTTDDIPTNDNSTLAPYNIIPMTKILTYNTIDGTWTSRQSPSSPIISNRYMHTANLLPYSGKILIYGGATDDGNEKRNTSDTSCNNGFQLKEIYHLDPSAVSDYLYLFDPKTLEYARIEEYESSLGAGPRFGHSAVLCNNTLFVLFGVNQIGLITNEVYFLSLTVSATWLKSFSITNSPTSGDVSHHPSTISNQAIIGITIALVLIMVLLVIGILFGIHYWRKRKMDSEKEVANEDEKVTEEDEGLPQLHKEYQRYSNATINTHTHTDRGHNSDHYLSQERYFHNNSPNEYELYNNNDSATLHDNHTPPRGFSFDHLVVHKPNQVKDQQPLTFIAGQQQQRSTSSFYLQPTTTPTTPVSLTTTSLVKPSL